MGAGRAQNLYDQATWHRLRGEYDLAAARLREALRKLVELAPDDAEAWLHLGDAELFTGDRPAARAAWTRASTRPGAEAEIKKRAQTRLGIYGETPSASQSQPTEREAHDGANR